MTLRWLLATLHLLALALGFAGIWARARALRGTLDDHGVRLVLRADTLWGVAAALWLATGLLRAFAGYEKGSAYYLAQPLFHLKLALFVAIVALELRPMLAFLGWRRALRANHALDVSRARTYAAISDVQTVLLVAMVFVATAIARGVAS
jgi:putative membrane protein